MPHRRRLRSASTEQLDVLTCRRSTIGGRAFPVAGEKVWNGLPSDVTSASSLSGVQEQTEDILVPPLLRNWRWITFLFPSHYLPPQNSGPCNSFHCLGHSKNVYDDDDDELLPTGPAAGSSKPEAAGSLLWDHAGTDRRMERCTDTVRFQRPCCAYDVVRVNKVHTVDIFTALQCCHLLHRYTFAAWLWQWILFYFYHFHHVLYTYFLY